MRRAALLAAIAAAGPVASRAAAWQGSAADQACVKAADGVDQDIAACASDEFDGNDKQLNAADTARLKDAEGPLKLSLTAA